MIRNKMITSAAAALAVAVLAVGAPTWAATKPAAPAKPSAAKPPAAKPAAPKAAPAPVAKKPAPEAVAEFERLTALIKAAKAVRYSSRVHLLVPPKANAAPASVAYGVDVTVQQPDRFRVAITTGDTPTLLLTTSPDAGYIVDQAKKSYAKFESPDSPVGFLVGISRSGTGLLADDDWALLQTLQTVIDEHPFDITSGQPSEVITTTYGDTVFNSKPVKKIVQSGTRNGTTMAYRFFFDPATGLPVHIEQSLTRAGKTIVPYQEDFSSFTVSDTVYPDSDFAFKPAADQTAYVHPTDPSAPVLLAKGTVAPDFKTTALDGSSVTLASLAGKIVVLDFWATWCGPCQLSLPGSNKLAADYASKGVVFLGICSWDTKDNFAKWLGAHKSWAMQFAFDPAGEDQSKSIAYTKFGVFGIPTQYIIGRDGKVVGSMDYYDPSDRHVRKLIDSALAQ